MMQALGKSKDECLISASASAVELDSIDDCMVWVWVWGWGLERNRNITFFLSCHMENVKKKATYVTVCMSNNIGYQLT